MTASPSIRNLALRSLLPLWLAGCSGQPGAADLGAADLSSGPDLAGADLKALSCAELVACLDGCRQSAEAGCETRCLGSTSPDALAKLTTLGTCTNMACPSSGVCQDSAAAGCRACIAQATAAGGACRTQAQACGL